MPPEKSLFIPLRTQWFRMFEAGTKTTEYRAYGDRWNERTCRLGRPATVSHGYSGARLQMRVVGFKKLLQTDAPDVAKEIFPEAEFIAAIELSQS
jgi:hypothetical protein